MKAELGQGSAPQGTLGAGEESRSGQERGA
jgi:hypothetical protein